ncbi:hypothetical protein BQ8482_110131 [Mesorhizobium delmotii]|uniref:Uncharacterized protein n=1 Tax=Mesorhizobium delmotii TaxID=1631247 RepID=A0A2P9AAN8_9HYPH|nr:hypothetical protein BQ8482_110131 [Mesorhizobium delmotii]
MDLPARGALGCADIQVRPASKWQLPALPVLTYFKYAPLRFSEPTCLVASRPSSTPARPDLNLNTPFTQVPQRSLFDFWAGALI